MFSVPVVFTVFLFVVVAVYAYTTPPDKTSRSAYRNQVIPGTVLDTNLSWIAKSLAATEIALSEKTHQTPPGVHMLDWPYLTEEVLAGRRELFTSSMRKVFPIKTMLLDPLDFKNMVYVNPAHEYAVRQLVNHVFKIYVEGLYNAGHEFFTTTKNPRDTVLTSHAAHRILHEDYIKVYALLVTLTTTSEWEFNSTDSPQEQLKALVFKTTDCLDTDLDIETDRNVASDVLKNFTEMYV